MSSTVTLSPSLAARISEVARRVHERAARITEEIRRVHGDLDDATIDQLLNDEPDEI